MGMELVSIIMAAYNAERTIELAIKSIQSQSYPFWELLVINDCSIDATPVIVSSLAECDSRIHLLNNERNSGVSVSRQRGMEVAKGDWIAILDSDDMWAPEKLEKQLTFARNTDAELIFTGSAFIDCDGNPIAW